MKDLIYKQIKDFHRQYKFCPCTGFLVGVCKCSLVTVCNSLHQLAEEKKIKVLSGRGYKIKIEIK